MKTKVLIPVPINKLRPIGGPYGYLFNLNSGLKNTKSKDVEVVFLEKSRSLNVGNSKWKKRLWKAYKVYQIVIAPYKNSGLNVEKYEMIHFHGTLDLYIHQKILKKYKGVILLTSHSPVVWHKEFQEILGKKYKMFHSIIKRVDKYAFEKADYLIFPCEEAEEPYYRSWNDYPRIRKNKKIKYLATGIKACNARVKREEIKERLNIPLEAHVICYTGRHNQIKGYDILKKAYEEYWKHRGFYVLVLGKEDPMKGLKNDKQWIEIGWTDDPHSYMNAADIFVLPNRETYFDLVLLEAMSLNKDIILSETGGNKFFKKFHSDNILFFNSNDYDDLGKCVNFYFENKCQLHRNREIYDNNFTQEIFADNYLKMIESIG